MRSTILFVLVVFAVLLESANSKKRNEKTKNDGAGGDDEWPHPGSVGGFEPPSMFQEAPKAQPLDKQKSSFGSSNGTQSSHSGRSHKH